MDLIIRNGTVVTHGEIYQADVGIEGGKVKQIGQGLGPAPKRSTLPANISSRRSGRPYPRRF